MKETDLYEQLAQYMNLKHPNVIYHFDLSGMWTPSHKARNLYGRLNKRAWPDLFIAHVKQSVHKAQFASVPIWDYGLFIELKTTSPYLKDGKTLKASPHLAEQAMMLKALESQGYKAVFAAGFDQAIQIIEEYLQT